MPFCLFRHILLFLTLFVMRSLYYLLLLSGLSQTMMRFQTTLLNVFLATATTLVHRYDLKLMKCLIVCFCIKEIGIFLFIFSIYFPISPLYKMQDIPQVNTPSKSNQPTLSIQVSKDYILQCYFKGHFLF